MQLGKRLKLARIENDLTQAELAKKANVSEVTICHMEKGKHYPRKETIERICGQLGINAEDFERK